MSQQGGAAAVSSEQVRNAISHLEDRGKSMLTNITSVSGSMMTAVDYLSILGDKEKVATYRELMVNLGKLEHEVTTNQEVLTQFRQTYQASQEETDFKAQLEQRLQDRLQQKPYDTRADSRLREFEGLAGGGGAGGSGAVGGGADSDDLGDDEDLEMNDGGRRWINDNCPLCMRPVLELEKPYKDTLGYVYEYASIMEFLRNRSADNFKHPVAGVQLQLRDSRDLVPAEEVMRAKRRQRLRKAMLGADGGAGGTHANNVQTEEEEEVIDV